jgi:hypothetical protein
MFALPKTALPGFAFPTASLPRPSAIAVGRCSLFSGNFGHELLERGKLDLDHVDGRLVLE